MSLFSAPSSDDDRPSWAKGITLFNLSSPLNDLLDKGEYTLEDLLVEDELIQELKSRNSKLLEFLSTEHAIQKMIQYATKPPTNPDENEIVTLKYPYMSCEVICCDVYPIIDTLVQHEEGKLVEELLQFLEIPGKVDPRHAGYFEKIMSLLLFRRPNDSVNIINKHSKILLNTFAAKIDSISVLEIFKRILQPFRQDMYGDPMDYGMSLGMGMDCGLDMGGSFSGENSASSNPDEAPTLIWESDPSVVQRFVANLSFCSKNDEDYTDDSEIHYHSAQVLIDIIHNSTPGGEISCNPHVLMETLESESFIMVLLNLAIPMTKEEANGTRDCPPLSSQISALMVLGSLAACYSKTEYGSTGDTGKIETNTPLVLSLIATRIPQLCASLTGENESLGKITTQYHIEVPRLGLWRLRLVAFVEILIHSKYLALDEQLEQGGVIKACIDLLFQFELHNMLHVELEHMVMLIFDSGSTALLQGLVTGSKVIEQMIDAIEQNAIALAQPKGYTRGYMGTIYRILNMMNSSLQAVAAVEQEAEEPSVRGPFPKSVIEPIFHQHPQWDKLNHIFTNELVNVNAIANCDLGGVVAPTLESEADDEMLDYSASGFNSNTTQNQPQDFPSIFSAEADSDIPFNLEDLVGENSPTLPEIDDVSSSSDEEEDEDEDDDFDEFNPRSDASASSPVMVTNEMIPSPMNVSSPTMKVNEALDESSKAMEAADVEMSNSFSQMGDEKWANFDTMSELQEKNRDFADFNDFPSDEKDAPSAEQK